jgi:hypothetical protein
VSSETVPQGPVFVLSMAPYSGVQEQPRGLKDAQKGEPDREECAYADLGHLQWQRRIEQADRAAWRGGRPDRARPLTEAEISQASAVG